jgi:hypothetical protein
MTQTETAQIEKLAALLIEYLPAAIERFGSLDVAVTKLVALMALEGSA